VDSPEWAVFLLILTGFSDATSESKKFKESVWRGRIRINKNNNK
jgi:hypothetical protein